jgi:DNA-binding MarR family transcriptional regulator
MSRDPPYTTSLPDPPNIGILLRRPFQALVQAVDERLAASGHGAIRPAHGNVFQFFEPQGTRVSVLAERAQMTKQSMGELVAHLERHGYVERVPDPADRRAKLIRLTDDGRAAVPVALAAIRDTTAKWRHQLGPERFHTLREILEDLNRQL